VDPLEAAVRVLRDAGEPLHWTRIQDEALRAGFLDPFTMPDVRRELLASLARGVREGAVEKVATGVYRVPDGR
jgi:hypothetical protein